MGGTRRLSTPIRRYLAWLWLYLVPRWWSLYVPRWSWKIFRNLSRRTFRHRTTFTLAIEFLLLVHNTSETLVLLAQYQLRRDNGSMFSRRRLCFFQSSFSENTSGWGLDYLWWWLAKQHGLGKFAVVDEIGMLHTRAVGTAMSGGAKSNPRVEEDALYEKFNFRKEKPRTLSYNTQPLKILANKIFNHRNYCTKRFY